MDKFRWIWVVLYIHYLNVSIQINFGSRLMRDNSNSRTKATIKSQYLAIHNFILTRRHNRSGRVSSAPKSSSKSHQLALHIKKRYLKSTFTHKKFTSAIPVHKNVHLYTGVQAPLDQVGGSGGLWGSLLFSWGLPPGSVASPLFPLLIATEVSGTCKEIIIKIGRKLGLAQKG